jgi:hypothetical protein
MLKSEFMFLFMIIPGPYNPGRNIEVCLQSLIDELNNLWSVGALTCDVLRK